MKGRDIYLTSVMKLIQMPKICISNEADTNAQDLLAEEN